MNILFAFSWPSFGIGLILGAVVCFAAMIMWALLSPPSWEVNKEGGVEKRKNRRVSIFFLITFLIFSVYSCGTTAKWERRGYGCTTSKGMAGY